MCWQMTLSIYIIIFYTFWYNNICNAFYIHPDSSSGVYLNVKNRIITRKSCDAVSRKKMSHLKINMKNRNYDSNYQKKQEKKMEEKEDFLQPKKSLSQNFLIGVNWIKKIVNTFSDSSINGMGVIEVGPGPGALTDYLYPNYPSMLAVEIDQRAIKILKKKFPFLTVIRSDCLQVDWIKLHSYIFHPGDEKNKSSFIESPKLSIIGNLPYHITSQILFSILDNQETIGKAVFTMQYEVAERLIAKTRTKQYGILSVIFQLYCIPKINFKIPNTAFNPQPKIDSAVVTLEFTKERKDYGIDPRDLRTIVRQAFQQRRKILRKSLKPLYIDNNKIMNCIMNKPEELIWLMKRPEELTPMEFIELTKYIYGEKKLDIDYDYKTKIWKI